MDPTLEKCCRIGEGINRIAESYLTLKGGNRMRKKLLLIFVPIVLPIILFFALGGPDYIARHSQSGVAYVSVFWNGKLLQTNNYDLTSTLDFQDYQNAYKADISYGEIRATLHTANNQNIEFGFINTNNWHNIHIRLDVTEMDGALTVRQTVSYETDNNMYQVDVTEKTENGKELSVFKDGI